MQLPILQGIYTNENSDIRFSYPRNLIPVPSDSGISLGYLRPSEGLEVFATGPGVDRGAIDWNGVHYRVMGSKLVSVSSSGTITIIGDVGNDALPVSMDYSFDRLAIASNQKLFLYDGITLVEVTDPDLGIVLDVIWVDGYFMTTDGEYLVVTELLDPTQVDLLKYGSSESDPDPIVAIKKLINEPYAINRYSIETFDNVGGSGFPFQRIDGAKVSKGAISTHGCCVLNDTIVFLGSGRNEQIAVWRSAGGAITKLSTREVDLILKSYSTSVLESVEVESRLVDNHEFIYLHFPDRTLVYDKSASDAVSANVWHELCSTFSGIGQYRAKHIVKSYDKWLVGDPKSYNIGELVSNTSNHYTSEIGWEFSTKAFYNEGRNGIVHELELVALTGRVDFGDNPVVWTSYSVDGETWSIEKYINAGIQGQRSKKLVWFNQGMIYTWRIQKFRGTSQVRLSIVRLEARIEGLRF